MEFRINYGDGEEFEKDSLEDLIESIIDSIKDASQYKEVCIVKIEYPY